MEKLIYYSDIITGKSILTRYSISSNGLVRNTKTGRILKAFVTQNGYLMCILMVNGKKVHVSIHRAVAICFVKNPMNLSTVNHKDFNKKNNNYKNLEWLSFKENIEHYHKYKFKSIFEDRFTKEDLNILYDKSLKAVEKCNHLGINKRQYYYLISKYGNINSNNK